MANIMRLGGGSGGGAKLAVTLNEDGTQNLLISDNGTVFDLASLTADADAAAEDVTAGKVFYAQGMRLVGENVPVDPAPVLLWENASPTSAFAAQTISLPTGYNGYIVEILSYYNRTEKSYGFFNVGSGYSAVLAYTGSQTFGRLINSAAANNIQFGGPVMNSYGNNEGIPQRIWGVKFTL